MRGSKIFISGICGFVGSSLAEGLCAAGASVCGCDNLSRRGSEKNLSRLRKKGVDARVSEASSPPALRWVGGVDWVIDASANPSVTAGTGRKSSSRALMKDNLWSTVNLLELCKKRSAGMIFLSTSRVYSIPEIRSIPLEIESGAFRPLDHSASGFFSGLPENFSTRPPLSLYGASKLASEVIALEYASAFGFPAWVNRCGLIAGAGQFGKPGQGIVSYWIHSWCSRRQLRYSGFDGRGHQTRDCLHPSDLLRLIMKQISCPAPPSGNSQRTFNVSGGSRSAFSLRQLSQWCASELGEMPVGSSPAGNNFDVPWVVLDSSVASGKWEWSPKKTTPEIFAEIAAHAKENPLWLDDCR